MSYTLKATQEYKVEIVVAKDISPYLDNIFSSFKEEKEIKEAFVNRILKETILSLYQRKVLETVRQEKQKELEQTQQTLSSDLKELM